MTHDERVYHHLYETCEGIAEQSERIASLEELALEMAECIPRYDCEGCSRHGWCAKHAEEPWWFEVRMQELGVVE